MIAMQYDAPPHTNNDCAIEYTGNEALDWLQCITMIEMVYNEHTTHAMNVQLSTMNTVEYNDNNGIQW